MRRSDPNKLSASALRAEVGLRNLVRGAGVQHEVSFGSLQSVVYMEDEAGRHGNFLQASYRRILADPEWAARLGKTYTGSARLPRSGDRWRGELECAGSSDALLMNVFCYPGVLRRPAVCACLGVESGMRASFGVRANLSMRRGEVDRTELDMAVGELLVEAKLTEGGFGTATMERLLRYEGVAEMFALEALPRNGDKVRGYQVIRGVLAALRGDGRYLVLLDGRRQDLQEICFQVLRAVRASDAGSRFRLLSWQELAVALPKRMQVFLAEKYGVVAM